MSSGLLATIEFGEEAIGVPQHDVATRPPPKHDFHTLPRLGGLPASAQPRAAPTVFTIQLNAAAPFVGCSGLLFRVKQVITAPIAAPALKDSLDLTLGGVAQAARAQWVMTAGGA
jgi:hypothetical protein